MKDHADQFDCNNCQYEHYCDEAGEWPGSQGASPVPIIEIRRAGYQLHLHTCLIPMITDHTRLLFRLSVHYKNGLMPFKGGLLEQPNVFLRAMEIINP